MRTTLHYRYLTLLVCGVIGVLGYFIYRGLPSDFLPEFDEGRFVIDYTASARDQFDGNLAPTRSG